MTEARRALTEIAAECHRAKWQFDFNDENRLPVGQARDMVKRAFGELHRIGDIALKQRDALARSPAPSGEMVREACAKIAEHYFETNEAAKEMLRANDKVVGENIAKAIRTLALPASPSASVVGDGVVPSTNGGSAAK